MEKEALRMLENRISKEGTISALTETLLEWGGELLVIIQGMLDDQLKESHEQITNLMNNLTLGLWEESYLNLTIAQLRDLGQWKRFFSHLESDERKKRYVPAESPDKMVMREVLSAMGIKGMTPALCTA